MDATMEDEDAMWTNSATIFVRKDGIKGQALTNRGLEKI